MKEVLQQILNEMEKTRKVVEKLLNQEKEKGGKAAKSTDPTPPDKPSHGN